MPLIGIMGGTFNPIHIGHIEIAKAAYEQYHLDEVWFMPNHIPAYKDDVQIVSGDMRLEMVRRAVADYPFFKVSDFELRRDGNTYTIDTLQQLTKEYPENHYYFIMGADSLFSFDKWMNYREIPQYAKLLVAPRNEQSKQQISDKIEEYNRFFGKSVFYAVQCKEIPCSSSDIRVKLQGNGSIIRQEREQISKELYLTQEVVQYILENGLYY